MIHKVKYNRLPYQRDFDESEKFYDLLSAGYGGGKTYALVMKCLKLASINRGLPAGLLCPNYKMFKRDVLPTFEEICFDNRVPFKFNKQDFKFTFPTLGVVIFVFHSEDDGYSIKGPNLAWGAINEVNSCSKKAFDAFIARIRLKRAKLRQVAMSGTPEGFNWLYDFLIKNKRDDADVFFGDMRLNRFVADDYARMLLSSYDEVVAQQYVEGKFVNINGLTALHKFNRFKHVGKVERIDGLPVWVCCDFNVSPMAATLFNRMPPDSKIKLRGFAEVNIRKNADSYDLAKAIKEKAGPNEIVVFPDPAGNSRSTKARAGITDIHILKEGGLQDIRYKSSIKSVRDCLNSANAILARGEVILDEDNCSETIIDFEQTTIKEGTTELDKSDPMRTHWVDGFKNMIDYEFPIAIGAGGWKQVRIR